MATVDPVGNEIEDIVRRVLQRRHASIGFRRADVRAGSDHDGDPVLFIDAHYDFNETPIPSTVTFGVTRELRRALEAIGETRFPHIRHHFDDRQRVAVS